MLWNSTKPIGDCSSQEIAIAQLISASTGRFDAALVLRDLETHHNLWTAFLMGRPFLSQDEAGLPHSGLLALRDLKHCWNLDTLYILAHNEGCVAPLLQLTSTWGCDSGHYDWVQSERLLAGRPAPIVWAWWD